MFGMPDSVEATKLEVNSSTTLRQINVSLSIGLSYRKPKRNNARYAFWLTAQKQKLGIIILVVQVAMTQASAKRKFYTWAIF